MSGGTEVYSAPFQRGRWRWGSWQRTGRRWSDRREADERDIQQGHDDEMKMVMEKCATQIPFTLSQSRCAHIGKVRISVWTVHCDVRTRKMCVCARTGRSGVYTSRRTHGCCYRLSAKLRCSTFCRRLQSDLPVDGDNVEIFVLSRVAPVSWMLLIDFFENASSMLSHSPLFWPFVVLPPVRVPFLATVSPWRRTPTCWAWWPAGRGGWLWRLFCEVFNLCSAIPRTLVVKDQFHYASASFRLLGQKELVLLFSSSVDLTTPFSLPGTWSLR